MTVTDTSPLLGVVVAQLGVIILSVQGLNGPVTQLGTLVFGLGAVFLAPVWVVLQAYRPADGEDVTPATDDGESD